VQDVTQIQLRQLAPAAEADIRATLERHKVDLMAWDNPTTTLEELFLSIVRESQARPGMRAGSQKPEN
jgi:ABC-2 type transport system ATP-binding protein